MNALIRTGFKTTCDPAGDAECRIEGEMSVASVEDVIDLLEMIVRRLHSKIDEIKRKEALTYDTNVTPE
jgi:hypothetical protein